MNDIFGSFDNAKRKRKRSNEHRQASNAEVKNKFSDSEWLDMLRKMRQALTVARVNPAKAHRIFQELRAAGESRKLNGLDVLRVLDWGLKSGK